MTLKQGNLWYEFECPSCYGNGVVLISFMQWYESHTMFCNVMKCIPVLSLKIQRHTFSQTNNFSQINKFFVYYIISLLVLRAGLYQFLIMAYLFYFNSYNAYIGLKSRL